MCGYSSTVVQLLPSFIQHEDAKGGERFAPLHLLQWRRLLMRFMKMLQVPTCILLVIVSHYFQFPELESRFNVSNHVSHPAFVFKVKVSHPCQFWGLRPLAPWLWVWIVGSSSHVFGSGFSFTSPCLVLVFTRFSRV